jgi:GTPase
MSVFTFDPDPPRVSSPWDLDDNNPGQNTRELLKHSSEPGQSLLSEYGFSRLPPEPQEGPVEYKLHLLLRPRSAYRAINAHSKTPDTDEVNTPFDMAAARVSMVPLSSSTQGRQERCQQLTTQLLWRLRQSSPYHSSTSYQDIVVPPLPNDAEVLTSCIRLARLAPGLEESRGALYEIGVADDGTLVGIIQDELDQSIATLRWMAASLGCNTDILRKVVVGEAQRLGGNEGESTEEYADIGGGVTSTIEKLWVAEVFVRPDLTIKEGAYASEHLRLKISPQTRHDSQNPRQSTTNQLRVTLLGPTASGKSSLVGTLATGQLDDGHGKTRQNSLKHRHELQSGLTSNVNQELVGYKDGDIVNYANPNIESWLGIHDYTKDGRLVLLSDSAGHPRYRRTTLRSIIGWAPHWTILCMATDHTDLATSGLPSSMSVDGFSTVATAAGSATAQELAKAHLQLCLKLELPLAVIVTKSDLTTKDSLKRVLQPVWAAIRAAGRTPQVLQSRDKTPEQLRRVSQVDDARIKTVLLDILRSGNFLATVPIILSSSVNGDGIGLVHALLENLPLPPRPTAYDYVGMALNPEQPATLYHIEDTFSLPASYASMRSHEQDHGTVVGGHLRFGRLSVGDKVVVGPFPAGDDYHKGTTPDRQPSPGFGLSSSHPSSSPASRQLLRHAVAASTLQGEWHQAQIVSVRNLRLPVQTLEAGQVGTIGLVIEPLSADGMDDGVSQLPLPLPKIRRGMVLAIPSKHMLDTGLQLQAASGLTAYFEDPKIPSLGIGTGVTFYAASVRASARILQVSSGKAYHDPLALAINSQDADDVFSMESQMEEDSLHVENRLPKGFEVRFELLYGREWIELGSRIVILEGASKDASVLDGFIGRIVEIVD